MTLGLRRSRLGKCGPVPEARQVSAGVAGAAVRQPEPAAAAQAVSGVCRGSPRSFSRLDPTRASARSTSLDQVERLHRAPVHSSAAGSSRDAAKPVEAEPGAEPAAGGQHDTRPARRAVPKPGSRNPRPRSEQAAGAADANPARPPVLATSGRRTLGTLAGAPRAGGTRSATAPPGRPGRRPRAPAKAAVCQAEGPTVASRPRVTGPPESAAATRAMTAIAAGDAGAEQQRDRQPRACAASAAPPPPRPARRPPAGPGRARRTAMAPRPPGSAAEHRQPGHVAEVDAGRAHRASRRRPRNPGPSRYAKVQTIAFGASAACSVNNPKPPTAPA